MTRTLIRTGSVERIRAIEGRQGRKWRDYPLKRYSSKHSYLKDKDLTLVPFQVAIAAQKEGFWVRSVIVWAKDNVMPEPVKDRPTHAHEYILMLAKSRRYYYDNEEAREWRSKESNLFNYLQQQQIQKKKPRLQSRNWRTVWQFPTSKGRRNHTASFPLELPIRCIKASTRPGDLVFDPFVGSGTTLLAAVQLGRQYIGCDISPEYVAEAERLLEKYYQRKDTDAVSKLLS